MELLHDPIGRLPLLIGAAYGCGLLASLLRLPPLIGFLLAGIGLRAFGAQSDELIVALSDLGVTLLMFTIGLKLDVSSLLSPVVWGGTTSHMLGSSLWFVAGMLGLGALGVAPFSGLGWEQLALLGFALSFSSTVFAIKMLEERGETASPHGATAIGILIMQDLLAVLFLTFSSGKLPSLAALLVLLLIPLRKPLQGLLARSGHGDLLVAAGLFLALFVGAFGFSQLGLKADLGALVVGVVVGSHKKAKELASVLLGFKEVLLIAFFMNIGLSESLSVTAVVAAALLVLLLPLKVLLYFFTMVGFRLTAHRSFLSTAALANFSEFGLIVGAVGVQLGVLTPNLLVVVALALTFSFLLASPLNRQAHTLELRLRPLLLRFESSRARRPQPIDLSGLDVVVFGMGRIGLAASVELERLGHRVLGVDYDADRVEALRAKGHRVERGDATDVSFWERTRNCAGAAAVVLAMPQAKANRFVGRHLRDNGYSGALFAVAHYPDELEGYRADDIDALYFQAQAGSGLGGRVHGRLSPSKPPSQPAGAPGGLEESGEPG